MIVLFLNIILSALELFFGGRFGLFIELLTNTIIADYYPRT